MSLLKKHMQNTHENMSEIMFITSDALMCARRFETTTYITMHGIPRKHALTLWTGKVSYS